MDTKATQCASFAAAIAHAIGDHAGCYALAYHTRAEFEQSEETTSPVGPHATYVSIALGGEAHGGWVITEYAQDYSAPVRFFSHP